MKKSVYLPLMAAMALCLYSCDFFKKNGGGEETESADSLTFCTVMYVDSATVVDAVVSQNMKVDFPMPEATGALADSIRAFLAEGIAANYFPMFEEEDSTETAFEYNIGEEQEYLDAYARKGMSHMVAELTQMAEDGWAVGYYNDYTASVATQTDKYVTYDIVHDIFTGGAHGLFIVHSKTFRKSDGCQMGWNLFDMSKKAELVALLKEGVKEYFEVETDEELEENLQVWDNPDTPENELEYGLPLPSQAPSVTRDGFSFVYQQYEIACYAAGLPSFTIPFDKIRNCLSQEGLELIGLK